MKKYILIIILTLLICFCSLESAHAQVKGGNEPVLNQVKGGNEPIKNNVSGGGVVSAGEDPEKLDDPLGEGVSLEGLLLKLFDIILYVGVPVVAFFLIWSGFMFIAAQGSPEKLETARSRLLFERLSKLLKGVLLR